MRHVVSVAAAMVNWGKMRCEPSGAVNLYAPVAARSTMVDVVRTVDASN